MHNFLKCYFLSLKSNDISFFKRKKRWRSTIATPTQNKDKIYKKTMKIEDNNHNNEGETMKPVLLSK